LHALPVDVRISQSPQTPGAAPTNPTDPTWHIHGQALRERYRAAVTENAALAPAARPVRVAYSAMHGVAGDLLKRTLERVGPMDWHEVSSQAAPNGDFPTVNFPNPEEPGALNHLLELAQRVEADIAIATDPDGDRLALALPDSQGQWQVLMGDQIGALLADYLLSVSAQATVAAPHDKRFILNTVVSSKLPARIAAYYGVEFEQTLTGFKWLWNRALHREAMGDRLVFAYEDAIGFSTTRRVRDKDGIAAAVSVVQKAQCAICPARVSREPSGQY
jgi:phosphomannomutase